MNGSPLTIVTWKWKPTNGYRSAFPPHAVNVLRRMVERHYPKRHRFVCVTDDPRGLDRGIDVVPLWSDFADVRVENTAKHPSCYRRLRAFSPDIAKVFGDRFVSLDLDLVITGELAPLWDRPEPFVCYSGTRGPGHLNGSMWLLTAGAFPHVWRDFDPDRSPALARSAGFFGSDQGWMSYCLAKTAATWGKADGVVSFRNEIRTNRPAVLPNGARVVVMHGAMKPWDIGIRMRYPWMFQHWR